MCKSTLLQHQTFRIHTTIHLVLHVLIFTGHSESSHSNISTQIQTPHFLWNSKSKENLRLPKFTTGETEKVEENSIVVGLDEKNKDVSRTRRTQNQQNQKPLRLRNESHNNKGKILTKAKRSLIIEDEIDDEGKQGKLLIDIVEENLEEQLLQAQLLQSTIKVSLRDPCNNLTQICEGDFVNCINGYCKCVEGYVPRPDNRDLCGERITYNIQTLQTDPTMIAFVVCLCLMSVTLCVVLRLFAKARFRENRTIFNTPNPRLMNVSLLKNSKKLVRGGSGPGGPRSPQSQYNDDDGTRDSLNSNQSLCGIEPAGREAQDQEEELFETQESKQTYPFKPIENEQPLSQDLPSGTTTGENPIKCARHKFFTGEDKSSGSRKNLYRYKQDSVTSNTAV